MQDYQSGGRPASWWKTHNGTGSVRCQLCPRGCVLATGERGFCGVRGNRDATLLSFSYGVGLPPTTETIETEALYHYKPGSRILSLGNIGCMLSCDFCQNWETARVEHLPSDCVCQYTPERIVEIALSHGIDVLSWTYNDPVVWHEFVMECAGLAREHGLRNIFKSSLYIQEGPLRELCDVIDAFSISLKSTDPAFYSRMTGGSLPPVLKAIQVVRDSGRHAEVSNLLVTGQNDDDDSIRDVARWVKTELGSDVPLHFVGFHPAYRLKDVSRTPTATLKRARFLGLEEGVLYCYIGNHAEAGINNTQCAACGHTLVSRFGLSSETLGIGTNDCCAQCGLQTPIKDANHAQPAEPDSTWSSDSTDNTHVLQWADYHGGCHIALSRDRGSRVDVHVRHSPSGRIEVLRLGNGIIRTTVAPTRPDDRSAELSWPRGTDVNVIPLLDRAHYPAQASSSAKEGR